MCAISDVNDSDIASNFKQLFVKRADLADYLHLMIIH